MIIDLFLGILLLLLIRKIVSFRIISIMRVYHIFVVFFSISFSYFSLNLCVNHLHFFHKNFSISQQKLFLQYASNRISFSLQMYIQWSYGFFMLFSIVLHHLLFLRHSKIVQIYTNQQSFFLNLILTLYCSYP